jgi:hypothetical protein
LNATYRGDANSERHALLLLLPPPPLLLVAAQL